MRHSVLFIEDEPRIRRVARLGLAQEGFDVEEADSGELGLAMLTERAFDVVCVDIMLPGCDGFEVCRRVRLDSDAPIIGVTARGDGHDVVRGPETGAEDYVSKPFVVQELSARIRALLRGGRPLHLTRTESPCAGYPRECGTTVNPRRSAWKAEAR